MKPLGKANALLPLVNREFQILMGVTDFALLERNDKDVAIVVV